MPLDGTDLKAESGSKLLIPEQDSDSSRFELKSSRARRDAGYALVAAIMAVAAFAYVAFEVLAAGQGGARRRR